MPIHAPPSKLARATGAGNRRGLADLRQRQVELLILLPTGTLRRQLPTAVGSGSAATSEVTTELEIVKADMQAVVDRTLQPAALSLWVRGEA
jgi:hypothetical protein